MTGDLAYNYEPLTAKDSIRLLALNPATERGTRLSCSMFCCRRSEQTIEYTAVSYAWGTPEFTECLEVASSSSGKSMMKITPIVDTMLRHLRSPSKTRFLWVDAICFNQSDESEKAHQVPQMGSIYKEAKDVRIWRQQRLGHESKHKVEYYLHGMLDQLPDGSNEVLHSAENIKDPSGLLVERMIYHCASEIFSQSWFLRRWVIQEALLARKAIVHRGSHRVSLKKVVAFAVWIQLYHVNTDYPVKMAATLGAPRDKVTLLEHLWHFHNTGCSDKKDRIAALLGLSPNEGFCLKYGCHRKDIYRQTAAWALSSENNNSRIQVLLHLFEFGPVVFSDEPDYPSWVPDWSKTRKRELPYYPCFKDIDVWGHYPAFLEAVDKSILALNDSVLRIEPRTPIGGVRSWQVVNVVPSRKDRYDTYHIVDMLNRLFPPSSVRSLTSIFDFSLLVQKALHFQGAGGWGESEAFDQYDGTILERLLQRGLMNSGRPFLHFRRLLGALRGLGTLLEEFCLFVLRPKEARASDDARALGIGAPDVLPSDIMVPLWRWEQSSRYDPVTSDWAYFGITTMLVLKYEHPWQSRGDHQKYEEVGSRQGKVVGPAICVELSDGKGTCQSELTVGSRSASEEVQAK